MSATPEEEFVDWDGHRGAENHDKSPFEIGRRTWQSGQKNTAWIEDNQNDIRSQAPRGNEIAVIERWQETK